MQFITGNNRHQTYFSTLEAQVAADNPVRLIDAFIDKLDLQKMGFTKTILKEQGRPPYAPGVLLKLYLYGYLNKIRSSRKLEKECSRNIELQWLLQVLQPNYHTIADFRKVHAVPLQSMFKLYVQFLSDAGLLGKKTIGIDGSKFKAVNSKRIITIKKRLTSTASSLKKRQQNIYRNWMNSINRKTLLLVMSCK